MSQLEQIAAGSTGSVAVIALVVGGIVVAVLIAAFVFGARRKEKEPPPAALSGPGVDVEQPRAGSWSEPAAAAGAKNSEDQPDRTVTTDVPGTRVPPEALDMLRLVAQSRSPVVMSDFFRAMRAPATPMEQ